MQRIINLGTPLKRGLTTVIVVLLLSNTLMLATLLGRSFQRDLTFLELETTCTQSK